LGADDEDKEHRMKQIRITPGGEICLTFPYEERIVIAIRETFEYPNYQTQERAWLLPPTDANLRALPAFQRRYGFVLTGQMDAGTDLMTRFQEARIAASLATDAPNLRIPRLGGRLRPFQRAGVAYMARTRRCLVADEMGLGKTVEALAALAYVNAFPALIVVPAMLLLYWVDQVRRWLPGRTVAVLNGNETPRANVYLISYARLWRYLERHPAFFGGTVKLRGVVCDEAHYLKERNTRRTQAVQRAAKYVPYRFFLTGTPVLNRPQELISLLYILGTLYPLGGVWQFRRRIREAGPQGLEQVHNELRVWGFLRRKREQVLPELPEKERVQVPMAMADRAAYQELEWNFLGWAQREGRKANPLTRLTALRQEVVRQKMPAVITWLEAFLESGEKVVVFGHHREALEQLGEAFDAPVLYGGLSGAKQQAMAQQFQDDPAMQVLVASVTVGGTGWTWTAARHAVFVEMDWTPARHDQAEDRLLRIGQRRKVTIWYLLAPESIDTDIWKLHERKRRRVDALTDGDQDLLQLIAAMRKRREMYERQ
jgi:SNF2 family DNA or RNA helicase